MQNQFLILFPGKFPPSLEIGVPQGTLPIGRCLTLEHKQVSTRGQTVCNQYSLAPVQACHAWHLRRWRYRGGKIAPHLKADQQM